MHDGLAQLLNCIHTNGYKILYLTQDSLNFKETLQNLFSVNKLPLGPVIKCAMMPTLLPLIRITIQSLQSKIYLVVELEQFAI